MSLYHNIDATSKPASAGAGSGSSAAAAGTAAAAAATDDNDTLLDDDDNDDAGVPHVPFEKQCPATYKELGNSTWTYLHTMAAYYPERPSTALAASMTPFLRTFAQIYPCETCRDHMIKYVDAHPPRAGSNAELSLYLCEFHNDVSRELGKPQVPCDAAALIRRYRDGPEDGSCD
jgi:FAD-linked sulfhydryl oxidase